MRMLSQRDSAITLLLFLLDGIQRLLVRHVIDDLVGLHAGVHELLCVGVGAIGQDRLVHLLRSPALRPERRERVEHHVHTSLAQLLDRPQRRLAELCQVNEHRDARQRLSELLDVLQRVDGLGEDGVSASLLDVHLGAVDRGVDALDGERVSPRHDDDVLRATASGVEARYHLIGRHHLLVGPVPAALGGHLILHVHCAGTRQLHVPHAALDVERRGAEAGVDVHERRRRRDSRQAAHIHEHVVERGHAQVGHAVVHQSHATAADVDRRVPKVLGHPSHVRAGGAHDLERFLGPLRLVHEGTEAGAGRARARAQCPAAQ
mmetsp:Transcript_43861/g.113267  ORF Transcript_43861/g.113267 Transcript_43861/m.113267 type:complete len:319 (+) Transcript_43861:213-1169(+)